jgi:hypothetical protein
VETGKGEDGRVGWRTQRGNAVDDGASRSNEGEM